MINDIKHFLRWGLPYSFMFFLGLWFGSLLGINIAHGEWSGWIVPIGNGIACFLLMLISLSSGVAIIILLDLLLYFIQWIKGKQERK